MSDLILLWTNNSFKRSPQEDKKLPRWHPSRRRSPPAARRRKDRSRSRSRSRSLSRSRSKSRSVSPENKTRTKAFDPKRLGKKSPKPKGKGGKPQKGKRNSKGWGTFLPHYLIQCCLLVHVHVSRLERMKVIFCKLKFWLLQVTNSIYCECWSRGARKNPETCRKIQVIFNTTAVSSN